MNLGDWGAIFSGADKGYQNYQAAQRPTTVKIDNGDLVGIMPDGSVKTLYSNQQATTLVPAGSALIGPQHQLLFKNDDPKPQRPLQLDLGDRIELRDPVTRQLIATIPKGASPNHIATIPKGASPNHNAPRPHYQYMTPNEVGIPGITVGRNTSDPTDQQITGRGAPLQAVPVPVHHSGFMGTPLGAGVDPNAQRAYDTYQQKLGLYRQWGVDPQTGYPIQRQPAPPQAGSAPAQPTSSAFDNY